MASQSASSPPSPMETEPLTGAGTAAPADVALELELEPQPAQEEVPPARRERTLSRSIMKPQPEAEAGGAAEPPAETEAARRPRTKSVVWKDATPPKKAPKGTPRAELSTVVTFPREPGTNARKLPRRAQPQPERRTCLCTVLYGLVILAICGGVVAVLMLGDSGTR